MAQKNTKRVGAWVIMILLFVGLIGFGSANLSGTIRSIGTAGEKRIPVQAYANALSQQIDAFSAQLGTTISFPQAQSIGLDRQVLGQLVGERVLDNEAAQLGLSVGDSRVAERVRALPAFRGLSGDFDREAYRFTLEANGLSEAEFETQLREEMARTLLQVAVIGGTTTPDAYAEALTAFIGERRTFGWASVTDVALEGELPAPTEEEIVAHYEANPEAYTRPEQRRVTYAAISPEAMQDEVEVDEQAIRDLYDARIDDFVQPERRLVERLVFSDAATAEAALTRISEGGIDFDALVTERGLDLSDVDLGDVAPGDLGDAAEGVFAAEPGDVVGPFETSLGPALFRMNAILSAQEIPFEEARDDLRAELAQDRARREIDSARNEIEDLLAGGAAIEDLAERTMLELGSTEWQIGRTDGIAAYEAFRAAARSAEIGAFPELTELADGGLLVLRLDEIVPPALQPLDEVRQRVIADRAAAARAEAIIAEAERIAEEVEGGAEFSDFGIFGFSEVDIIRRDFIAGAPRGLIQAVFEMEPGEARMVSDPDGVVAVVRLDSVDGADMADPAMVAEREAIAERASQAISQDIYTAFTNAVQARTEITLDQAAINAVHGSFQ